MKFERNQGKVGYSESVRVSQIYNLGCTLINKPSATRRGEVTGTKIPKRLHCFFEEHREQASNPPWTQGIEFKLYNAFTQEIAHMASLVLPAATAKTTMLVIWPLSLSARSEHLSRRGSRACEWERGVCCMYSLLQLKYH